MIMDRTEDNRLYGIDFLRLILMFMVVMIHVLGAGGVLQIDGLSGISYLTAWTIRAAILCAVNTFALISGFVGYKSKPRFSRIADLWLQVVFWNAIIFIIHMCNDDSSLTSKENIKLAVLTFFPVSSHSHWYITEYTGLCLFMPALNHIIENMPKKYLKYMIISIFIMFSLNPVTLHFDPFIVSKGFSMIWLIILYIIGGYLKKYNILELFSNKIYVSVYIFCTMLTVAFKLIMENTVGREENLLLIYPSFTLVLSAVSLVGIFSDIKLGQSMQIFVKIFSPCALGVYIIHKNVIVMENIINGIADWVNINNCFIMVLEIFGITFSVFVVCIILEFIRLNIFRALKISESLKKIDVKIFNRINRN